jgi:hypothetical protein
MNEPPVDPRARPRALPRKANAPKMTMAQAAEALDRDRAGMRGRMRGHVRGSVRGSATIQRRVGSGQAEERESADSEVPEAATSDFREAFSQARAESSRGAAERTADALEIIANRIRSSLAATAWNASGGSLIPNPDARRWFGGPVNEVGQGCRRAADSETS